MLGLAQFGFFMQLASDELSIPSFPFLATAAVGVMIGTAFMGVALDRWRHLFSRFLGGALVFAFGLLIVPWLTGFASDPSDVVSFLYPIILIGGMALGAVTAAWLSMVQLLTTPEASASFFAIMMSFGNLAQLIGNPLGGALASAICFQWTFFSCFIIALLALPGIIIVLRNMNERMLADDDAKTVAGPCVVLELELGKLKPDQPVERENQKKNEIDQQNTVDLDKLELNKLEFELVDVDLDLDHNEAGRLGLLCMELDNGDDRPLRHMDR